jgi:flagellar basal-body rod protein FlgB
MKSENYNLLKNALNVSTLRQRMISSNLANINTPGYKVNKVEFEKHLKEAGDGMGLQKTHDRHFGVGNIGEVHGTVKKRESTANNENGNNVDVDLEMTEMAANELYYATLISLLNSKYSKINSAINK